MDVESLHAQNTKKGIDFGDCRSRDRAHHLSVRSSKTRTGCARADCDVGASVGMDVDVHRRGDQDGHAYMEVHGTLKGGPGSSAGKQSPCDTGDLGKQSPCDTGDLGSIPESGRPAGDWLPAPVFLGFPGGSDSKEPA